MTIVKYYYIMHEYVGDGLDYVLDWDCSNLEDVECEYDDYDIYVTRHIVLLDKGNVLCTNADKQYANLIKRIVMPNKTVVYDCDTLADPVFRIIPLRKDELEEFLNNVGIVPLSVRELLGLLENANVNCCHDLWRLEDREDLRYAVRNIVSSDTVLIEPSRYTYEVVGNKIYKIENYPIKYYFNFSGLDRNPLKKDIYLIF